MKNWVNTLTDKLFFFTERVVKDQEKWKGAASFLILSSANSDTKIKDM